jgi:hypothetical protein
MDIAKVRKLITRLDTLVTYLNKHDEFRIHQKVDQFYYMQKRAELLMLVEQFEELQERLDRTNQWIDNTYVETFDHWRMDRLWLHRRSN